MFRNTNLKTNKKNTYLPTHVLYEIKLIIKYLLSFASEYLQENHNIFNLT